MAGRERPAGADELSPVAIVTAQAALGDDVQPGRECFLGEPLPVGPGDEGRRGIRVEEMKRIEATRVELAELRMQRRRGARLEGLGDQRSTGAPCRVAR